MREKNQDPAYQVISHENKQDSKTVSSSYHNISPAKKRSDSHVNLFIPHIQRRH